MQTLFKEIGETIERKLSRRVFALVYAIVVFAVSTILGLVLGSFRLGLILWCIIMSLSTKWFLVSVPEVTGLVTVNLLTGKLATYGTGLNVRYPWEQAKMGNYLNLRIETVERIESYPSKNGPLMMVKWAYQFKALRNRLDSYIGADDSTIKEGLDNIGSSNLQTSINKRDAEDCKKEKEEIEEELVSEFAKIKPEDLYGIELIKISLADIDYEEKYQRVRVTEAIAEKLKGIAKKLRTGDISEKDALNAAMIINGDIKKTVTEVEGKGGEALAALLMAMAQGKGGDK